MCTASPLERPWRRRGVGLAAGGDVLHKTPRVLLERSGARRVIVAATKAVSMELEPCLHRVIVMHRSCRWPAATPAHSVNVHRSRPCIESA